MLRKVLIVLAILVAVVGGFYERQFNINAQKTKEAYQERQRIMLEWVGAAESVAKTTKDEEALKIIEAVKRTYFLGVPYITEKSSKAILAPYGMPEQRYHIAVIPIIQSDIYASEEWRNELEPIKNASFAPYDKNIGMIILRNDPSMSPRRKGMIFLHFAKHLVIHATGGSSEEANDSNQAKAVEEYLADEFDFKIVAALGGEKYAKLMEKSTAEIVRSLRKKEEVFFKRPWFPSELENIFGKSDDQELRMLEDYLWTASLMQAYDTVYGRETEKSKSMKINFYREGEDKHDFKKNMI